MAEVIIRRYIATRHKNNPLDYSKYQNALYIDKVEREKDWIDYYVTYKHRGSVSDRRNGIALVHSGNVFYLIDKDNNAILSTTDRLIRIFGGYYVSLAKYQYDYRTFPGQDRDTEYEEMTTIHDIYDEDGKRLNKEQCDKFIKFTDILHLMTAAELGEGRVLFDNALYDLKDYSLIAKYQKRVLLEGAFENGRCKVRIPEDDRNFIVAVYEHKICYVFNEFDFERIRETLNLSIEKEKKLWSDSDVVGRKDVDDIECVHEYYPKPEVAIEKYHSTSPTDITEYSYFQLQPLFTDEFFEKNRAPGLVDYWMRVMACKYYKNTRYNCYLHIPYEGYKQLCDSIIKVNGNRPNHITKVSKLGECDILIHKKHKYEIYLFECRPYGYITTSGKLIYDFDINNIRW